MKPATLRLVVASIAAALMLGMWHLSRQPWSERQDITSGVNWRGTRDFTESNSPDRIGATFYFGGSSVLLLAAAGVVAMAYAGASADRMPGVIAFGAAILGGIALTRFTMYFNGFGSSYNQFGGSGHYPTDDAKVSLYATAALAVTGIVLLILGPPPQEAQSVTAPVSPGSEGQ